ncbi:MAG TPA: ABC transporter ATP-binding protein [Pirellulaceae bacterium]|nr:ABC transporter ATP-binding protein [Pirellulaceae bacterium]
MLVAKHVAKSYLTSAEPLVVLRDISLEVSPGESVAIVGPSGCGKSTLLHLLGTLDAPTSGSITLRGEDPFQLDEPRLAHFRSQNIGFVFQEHHLLPQLTVLENVLVPTLAEGQPDTAAIERANELLARVGLTGRKEHRPGELSGGERARVAVARALIRKPVLLLADEPTGALDRTTAGVIGKLLLEMQQQEQAILLVVTHNPDLANLMDRKLELDEGRLKTPSI